MWVTLYALWREYISLSLSLWARTQLSKLSLPSLRSVTSLFFPVKLKQNNPEKAKSISQVLLCKEKLFWTSFWHSNSRACSHTSVAPAKWLTEACAHLPAGAQFLSQSLTTGTHMYIVLPADPSIMTNAHTCYPKHWHTRPLSLLFQSPVDGRCSFNILSCQHQLFIFFLRGEQIIQWSEGQGKPGLWMEKNRSCWQQWGRRKRKREERVEGGKRKERRKEKRRGDKRGGEERRGVTLSCIWMAMLLPPIWFARSDPHSLATS